MAKPSFLKSYSSSLLLMASILVGAIIGLFLKEKAVFLKPLGDIFLNLLFTLVVPLVFFSISSAVAGMNDLRRLGKIMLWMLIVFIATGIISSAIMVSAVTFFKPTDGISVKLASSFNPEQNDVSQQIVAAFTVNDFVDLFSRKNMLALIIFALLIGLSASMAGEKGKPFVKFLIAGNEVISHTIKLVMLYAPIGLGAYFAYLVGVFGPQLLGSYAKAMAIYYPIAFLYFFFCFSIYAWLSAGKLGFSHFWQNILPPTLTALATGSSVATIPTNLEAAKRIGVPEDIREVVIPIGATIHMDGSCLSAILKISILFSIFHMNFTGFETILTAIGVALLSGIVMSGIPGGGFLGELLIVTLYGFPPEALPLISMVGTLVDPPATMVNSTGDTVASMLVSRFVNGKKWLLSR